MELIDDRQPLLQESLTRDRSHSLPIPGSPVEASPAEPYVGSHHEKRRLSDLLVNLVGRTRAGSLQDGITRTRRGSHQASVGSNPTAAAYSTGSVAKTVGARRNSFQVNPVDTQVLETYERLLHDQHLEGGRLSAGSETPGASSISGLPAPPPLKKLDDLKIGEEVTEPTCLICLAKFTQKRPPIQIPCTAKCNLAPVHARCIYEWKEQRSGGGPTNQAGSCPLCRAPLNPVDYESPDPLATKTLFMHSARRSFVSRPAPKAAGMVRAYIRVVGTGSVTSTPIKYELWLQAPTTRKYPNVPLPPTYGNADGDQLLMTARRRTNIRTCSSIIDISLDREGIDFARNGPNHLAAVKGSFFGLDYTITAPCRYLFQRESNQTLELGSVRFEQNRVGSGAGPRRISICLPAVREDPAPIDPWPPASSDRTNDAKKTGAGVAESKEEEEEDDDDDDDDEENFGEVYRTMEYVPQTKSQSLRRLVRSHQPPVSAAPVNAAPAASIAQTPNAAGVTTPNGTTAANAAATRNSRTGFISDQFIFARNRKPYYLESISAFSLDFFGRVTLPSNKNCLLTCDDSNSATAGPESNILLFGKIGIRGKNADATVYTLDFQWPLSPIQAFGIALASCDRKFGCA